MEGWYHHLPLVNATLNGSATLLLLWGYVLIKYQRRETAHKRVMISAFVLSILFLACYLVYHAELYRHTGSGSVRFQGPEPVRSAYLLMLLTHVVLAATVPVLAGTTIYLGYRDRRDRHRRWARWTFPIWLYVSITGVVIYVMLYRVYPPAGGPGAEPAGDSVPAAGRL